MANLVTIVPNPESATGGERNRSFVRTQTQCAAQDKPSGKIILPILDGFVVEKWKRIIYMEAQGNYTMLHLVGGKGMLICKTLGEVEGRLPMFHFVRIHRSHTIHLKHLVKYSRGKGGSVALSSGVSLAVSAGYRDNFFESLARYFY
ncbi:MAG: LytR/AlgR family response regulator transcription factor [Saprospiraceae bacterium]